MSVSEDLNAPFLLDLNNGYVHDGKLRVESGGIYARERVERFGSDEEALY